MALKILAAVDGGDLTERITTYALRIGKNAALHFLCAVDPAQLMSDSVALVFGEENRRSAAIEAAQKIVDRCVAAARDAGVAAEGHVVEEPPVDAILHAANRIQADLIIMSSHGRAGLARAVLGSVAEGVARQAKAAVLLVPSGLQADDPSRHLHQIFQGL